MTSDRSETRFDIPEEPTRVERGAGAASTGGETVPVEDSPRVPGLRGRRIGAYTLLRELGHGGQGYVYLAEDTRLHRKVALKLLPMAFTLSGKARMRFEREAEVASKLNHPGICTVYEVGEDDSVPFIAMPAGREGRAAGERHRHAAPALEPLSRLHRAADRRRHAGRGGPIEGRLTWTIGGRAADR